ncbi:MAG: AsmA-like C-terminal region-containing protein [Rikenellaceae bacterium]|nr:AsmA-like C-terminal region-containing protein [Rikenellaceae bacterium]
MISGEPAHSPPEAPDDSEPELDSEPEPLPVIDLQRIGIRNGHFIYEDRTTGLYTEVTGFNLRLRNQLTQGSLYSELKTGFESIRFDSPAYRLDQELALRFESKLNVQRGKIGFIESRLMLNELPFRTEGEIEKADDSLRMDVRFTLQAENLADILRFIPDVYWAEKRRTEANGKLEVRGRINGLLGEQPLPDVRITCSLEKGSLKRKGSSRGIEKLETDLTLFCHGTAANSSFVEFRKLELHGSNTAFFATGRADRLLTDPRIEASMQGTVDFEGIVGEIFNPDTLLVKGILNADIRANFRLWDLMDGDFGTLDAAGKFGMDRLLVADRVSRNSLFMSGVHFSADTARRSRISRSEEPWVTARLQVDTLHLRSGRHTSARVGALDAQLHTSRTWDTTRVQPVATQIRIDHLTVRLPDSVLFSGRKIAIDGGLKGSSSNPKMGMFGGKITLDTLRYADIPARTRLTMNHAGFDLEMLPLREAMRQRRTAGITRERRSTEPAASGYSSGRTRDSLLGGSSVRLATSTEPDSPDRLLRQWEIRSSIQFDRMRFFTELFPLPTRLERTTLKFDTDQITLSEARMNIGQSDLTLTGSLSGLRRAMLRNGVLQGNLSLQSDYLDCNQLMGAMQRSSLWAETGEVNSPELSGLLDEEEELIDWDETDPLAGLSTEEALEDGLFIVPKNLDLVLRTRIGKADFTDLRLEKIRGQVIVRNQSVNLRRLAMDSDIGSGNLTMVYTAREPQSAGVGFELELEDIIVERLLGMFPAINTLLPMLRSFEGVMDGQMTASCQLDSAMNVIFPTLHSACYLSGENMVLLDGETFSEISKKLMFKNKEKNLIDYISVDLSIRDNRIEIFPFKIEIDRYTLAVGGLHHLDMTFDYHISVLKSPVPFKLGIDIAGDLDDFKFKVVKCRYKDLFKATREEELQETRLNLRAGIRESIRSQLARNAPELAGGFTHERIRSRRPETAVTDMDLDDPEVPDEDSALSESAPAERVDQATGSSPEIVSGLPRISDFPDSLSTLP